MHQPYSRAIDLLEALLPHRDPWQPDPRAWVFRGQANAAWDIVPSAFRGNAPLRLDDHQDLGPRATRREQVRAERVLLGKFRQLADAQGLRIPGPDRELEGLLSEGRPSDAAKACEVGKARWLPDEVLGLAAIAQHYGVPTRLVDWTRRPLVAAWFAAQEAARWARGAATPPLGATHLAVWALFRRGPSGRLHDKSPVRVVTAPRWDNPNLHAQSGLFTHTEEPPGSPDAPPDTLALNRRLEGVELDGRAVLHALTLPIAEAPRLLALLSDHFVHGGVIYAGYAGAAAALREYPLRDG